MSHSPYEFALFVFMLAAFLGWELVKRVSPLLHQTILALFDDRSDPERTALLLRLAMMELDRASTNRRLRPRGAGSGRLSLRLSA